MKIILATGIYPPTIGGPATYVKHLSEELSKRNDVTVVTYGAPRNGVQNVPLGLPLLRWFRYAKKLKEVGSDADIIYCFSSVSCGVPLILSGLKKPKCVLRLGGDFFWERYTDWGGKKTLREWYRDGSWQLAVGSWLLRQFDHIVFSTRFQEEIYEKAYKNLPHHSVIQNALTFSGPFKSDRQYHSPFRLLFMGRFVRFKNIESLIAAMVYIPDATLTIVGEGPLDDKLRKLVERLNLVHRIQFVGSVSGKDKAEIFDKHDALVLPSLTEISPNVALEAKAAGLPVLITNQNGLGDLVGFMCNSSLKTTDEIVEGVAMLRDMYPRNYSSKNVRSWTQVASETEELFATLCAQ